LKGCRFSHIVLGSFLVLFLHNSQAQQTPPPPPSSPSAPQPTPEAQQQKTEEEKEIERKEQSQRILGVLPQFSVTSRQHAAPLTPREKFRLFAKAAFDPVTLGVVGLQAGISQAEDEFPGYGQGAAGYGKRYGASLADEVSSGFFSNYFYSTLLKEDPRYFRLGEGSVKRRLGYSLVQEFVCHTDNGKKSFSFENVLGAFTAGGISNTYYPSTDRGFGLTMSRSAIALAYGSMGGLVDEFWPDISHRLFGKHKQPQPSQGGTPQ
jgi:hypothetical protein